MPNTNPQLRGKGSGLGARDPPQKKKKKRTMEAKSLRQKIGSILCVRTVSTADPITAADVTKRGGEDAGKKQWKTRQRKERR